MREQVIINENLSLRRTDAGARFVCACGHDLAAGDTNFKEACAVRERSTADIGEGYASFAVEMAAQMCFREFFCPTCGVRLNTEVARVGDPFLWDVAPRL